MEYSFEAVYDAPTPRAKERLKRMFSLDRDMLVRNHMATMRRASTFNRGSYCGVILTATPAWYAHTNYVFVVSSLDEASAGYDDTAAAHVSKLYRLIA